MPFVDLVETVQEELGLGDLSLELFVALETLLHFLESRGGTLRSGIHHRVLHLLGI